MFGVIKLNECTLNLFICFVFVRRHGHEVFCVRYSQDSQWLAAGCGDGTIRVCYDSDYNALPIR